MALHEYPDLIQGTDEWHEVRLGIVTASVVGQLVTPTLKVASNPASRGIVAQLVAERITGWSEPTYMSDDMLRGWEDEPRARDAYAAHRGVEVVETGFMVRDDWGYRIGYSPDGLVGGDGLIEIKARRPKIHLTTILSGQVPASCMAQIQCGLLVSGREWCDYISYTGGMPLWIKRVHPDPRWHAAIVDAVRAVEQAAEGMTSAYHHAVDGLPMTERVTEMEMTF